MEKAIQEARDVKDAEDLDAIKEKISALQQCSQKIGQAIYGQQGGDAGGEEENKDDNTVDADFTEKKEEEEEDKKK